MIAAVTGGTGFIGRVLVQRLLRDGAFSEVRVLTRRKSAIPGARMMQGDLITDRLEAFIEGADVLFHCAGELGNPQAMRPLHVEGTRRLLAAARGRISRWVQLSSVGAYGRAIREGTVDERSPLAPEGEYETTKAEADATVGRETALHSVTLRPSIVFGPGMSNQSLYRLVAAIDRGVFFLVGRNAVANYVYVDDVADGLAACGGSARAAGVYNLSDDRPMEAFVGAIARELGGRMPRLRLPEPIARGTARLLQGVPGFPLTESRVDALSRRVRYPSARIEQELGFGFGVSIEEGLRRFVADWRARK